MLKWGYKVGLELSAGQSQGQGVSWDGQGQRLGSVLCLWKSSQEEVQACALSVMSDVMK